MNHELPWVAERVRVFRESDPEFARWARGHGPITHNDLTQLRVHDLAQVLVAEGKASDTTAVYRTLWSADRLAVAGMWLTVHMTYADRVYPDGREMRAEDFKETPEGHTGGALNIVPAYVGYLAANALSGLTRGWLMGQGHCVAGIDACNLLVGNMTPRHAERYDRSESGLTRFARDFYSYAIDAQGRPASPLAATSARIRQAVCPRAAISALPNCSTCTCPCPASGWWCSSATALSRSSVAVTGRRAGGGQKTAASWHRS